MRILVADDDRVSRVLLQGTLAASGYEVVLAEDGQQAWDILEREDAPRLAVIDWTMPGMDGLEVCRRVRARKGRSYVYILLVTGRAETDDLVMGIGAGADDYVTKPFDPHELHARLRAGVRILELQEALRVQATMDPLTGIWNRGAILEMLERELARAVRSETPVSVVVADIDHFKRVNDSLGHAAGDAVLCRTVLRLKATLRPYDGIGRYGGEEFLLVLPGCNGAHALEAAERVRLAVCGSPIDVGERSLDITVSLGVSASTGDAEEGAESLIRAADDALYRAKAEGRNRSVLAGTRSRPALSSVKTVSKPPPASGG